MWKNRFLGVLFVLFSFTGAEAADIYVAYPESRDPTDPAFYYQEVLRLALEKTRNTDGDFTLHYSDRYFSLGRATNMLINGNKADVMWGSVTIDRLEFMQVIPYDLLRGLNNYRVLIIKPESQPVFDGVSSLKQFKKFTSGGGSNWTVTSIQRRNGIKMSTATDYNLILKMLVAGRFDYIARGLHEAQGDLSLGKELGHEIAIESTILLRYQYPVDYSFFVSKHNLQLADRLNRGLSIAERDGGLLAVFNSMKVFRDAASYFSQNRKLFVLKNKSIVPSSARQRKVIVNLQ